jgi:putative transposase
MTAITTMTTCGETSGLCASVGVSRAAFYRLRRPAAPRPHLVRAASPRALRPDERQAVLDVLHSERFVDQSPAEVHASLLEEQTYLCSTRTMYRLLAAAGEGRERRDQMRHPADAKPELVTTRPNQIWSWDITKPKGPIAYIYFSHYVILDLFSRYVVGWMVAAAESPRLAERLIAATCEKQAIGPHQLTIHADRGAPMRSSSPSSSPISGPPRATRARGSVTTIRFPKPNSGRSNIGPSFRTGSARSRMRCGICHDLFAWYNNAHHHSGLQYLTPADVHYGPAATILAVRHQTRLAAFAAHPERFVQGPPRRETLPEAVWINGPTNTARQDAPQTTIVTPDDPQHGVILGPDVNVEDRPIVLVNSTAALR